MTDPVGSPLVQARLKISQVDAQTPPIEAERTARLLAKSCDRNQLADLLTQLLTAKEETLRQLQDEETRVFVVSRALELYGYRHG